MLGAWGEALKPAVFMPQFIISPHCIAVVNAPFTYATFNAVIQIIKDKMRIIGDGTPVV